MLARRLTFGLAALAAAFVAFSAGGVLLAPVAAHAQGFTVAFGSFDYDAAPGDKITGSIHVTNQVDTSLAVKVYLGDLVRNPNGSNDYDFDEQMGHEPRSLAKWLKVSPSQFDLAAKTDSDVSFELDVPNDPTLSGSYWAVIFVEREPTQAELAQQVQPNPNKKETRIGIRTIWRYATRIGVTIKGTKNAPAATFKSIDVKPENGKFVASAVLENQSNFYFQPKVWLEAQDESGKTVTKIDHPERTVLPESRNTFTFDIDQVMLPPGTYLLTVVADYGGPGLIGARAKVNVTPPPPGSAPPAAAKTSAPPTPATPPTTPPVTPPAKP